MARQIGSQYRETLEESGCSLHQRMNAEEVILRDTDGSLALYVANNHFAGAVIEIDGTGYEFVSCVTLPEVAKMMRDTD